MKIWIVIEKFFLNIARKIKLGKLADLYEQHIEGMRYLIFGGLATFINIMVYAICASIFFVNLELDIQTKISNIIAIILSMIFAYFSNKIIVFQSKQENKQEEVKEFFSFIICRIITAIIDMVLMNFTVVIMLWPKVLMKVLVNIIVIVLNFVFSKLWIFKKKNEKEI